MIYNNNDAKSKEVDIDIKWNDYIDYLYGGMSKDDIIKEVGFMLKDGNKIDEKGFVVNLNVNSNVKTEQSLIEFLNNDFVTPLSDDAKNIINSTNDSVSVNTLVYRINYF